MQGRRKPQRGKQGQKSTNPRNNRNQGNRPKQSRNNKKKMVSKVNPQDLIKKASVFESKDFTSEMVFSEFPIRDILLKNIEKKGYENPTEIQEKSIEYQLEGKDVIGIAETGSGKTGAFLIPIINEMLQNPKTQAVVILPTRELAQQVLQEFKDLTIGFKIKSACFIGGTNVNKDINIAKGHPRFIVGTPGRLKDLSGQRALNLKRVNILVLDEFDRMLDMGFIRDMRHLEALMRGRNQTVLFSATADPKQQKLIDEFVIDPIKVSVTSGSESSERVDQDIVEVKEGQNKIDVLVNMLQDDSFEKVIIFTETKRTANKLNQQLINRKLKSDVIHGNKSQNYRTKAIEKFKKGESKILIATDVAARGIDIKDISHVINYQLPMTMDSYIHRIGRTGRAGKTGKAFTFVN